MLQGFTFTQIIWCTFTEKRSSNSMLRSKVNRTFQSSWHAQGQEEVYL